MASNMTEEFFGFNETKGPFESRTCIPREEDLWQQEMKHKFRVLHLQGYVKWKVTPNGTGPGNASVQVKRRMFAGKEENLPVIELASWTCAVGGKAKPDEFVEAKFEIKFDAKATHEFWKTGHAGETV